LASLGKKRKPGEKKATSIMTDNDVRAPSNGESQNGNPNGGNKREKYPMEKLKYLQPEGRCVGKFAGWVQ